MFEPVGDGGVVELARDHRGDAAIGVQDVLPVLFVAAVVVVVTQRDEIVDVGRSAALPVMDVVELAHRDRGAAVGDCAGGVQRFNSAMLGRGGEPLGATDVEGNTVFQQDRCSISTTGEMVKICWIDRGAIGVFADTGSVGALRERVGIDENADVGYRPHRCGRAHPLREG
jgi:hypothetical protein